MRRKYIEYKRANVYAIYFAESKTIYYNTAFKGKKQMVLYIESNTCEEIASNVMQHI